MLFRCLSARAPPGPAMSERVRSAFSAMGMCEEDIKHAVSVFRAVEARCRGSPGFFFHACLRLRQYVARQRKDPGGSAFLQLVDKVVDRRRFLELLGAVHTIESWEDVKVAIDALGAPVHVMEARTPRVECLESPHFAGLIAGIDAPAPALVANAKRPLGSPGEPGGVFGDDMREFAALFCSPPKRARQDVGPAPMDL